MSQVILNQCRPVFSIPRTTRREQQKLRLG